MLSEQLSVGEGIKTAATLKARQVIKMHRLCAVLRALGMASLNLPAPSPCLVEVPEAESADTPQSPVGWGLELSW